MSLLRAGNPGIFICQRGSVLPITLVVLVVLALLGVASTNSSKTQTLIARNSHLKQLSFQESENVIRTGEADWYSTVISCLSEEEACNVDLLPAIRGVDSFEPGFWRDASPVGEYGRYVVEFLGQRAIPGDHERKLHIYRITSEASDTTRTAKTQLQSILRICVTTDELPCLNS